MQQHGLGAIRNLLYNLVRRDLTVRYKSTVLGFFWSFIKPLVLTGIFYVAFNYFIQVRLTAADIPGARPIPFPLLLLSGILAWTFFAGATAESMGVILANSNLIKKVRLPLGVFPLAAVCSHLVHFALALLVLFVLLIVAHFPPGPIFILLPALVVLHFALALALSLALSALNVFYRDVGSLWEVLTTAWFYATPIVYPAAVVFEKLQLKNLGWLKWVYLANPMTPLVCAYQRVLIYGAVGQGALGSPLPGLPDGELAAALGLCLAVTLALLAGGWGIFKKFSKSFADEL